MATLRNQARAPAPAARAPARPDLSEEDSKHLLPGRAVGYNRAGKPVQRAAPQAGVDQFHIPEGLPPPGWDWAWKEETVLGQIRDGEAAMQAQNGWEPVMYESYPGTFAPKYDDSGAMRKGPVRRGGLMLKERDITLTLEAMADDKRRADEKVGNASRQYTRLDTKGTTTVEIDHEARRMATMRKGYEPAPEPNGPTLD